TGDMQNDFDYRFSSEVFDSETGLVYYNFRYYSPELGRWLSRDPLEEAGGWNLYGMVNNNPVYFYDRYGLLSFPWYGNWGGPGWAGDQWVNDGWNNPASPNYVPGLTNVSPADDLDACYKNHDICYENCRNNKECSKDKDSCFSKCDYASVPCQLKALFGNNNWNGYLQAIPGAIGLGAQGIGRDGWNAASSAASNAWNAASSAANNAWSAASNATW
ncbi:MAG: RHS repeat-associated core domain-containing protein, partial [Victivallaceae bacterium]